MERAPYGRQRELPAAKNNSQPLAPQYRGETYYDLPALKPSHYGQLVASYLFIGGLAGASQVIATVADLCGSEKNHSIVRSGRYVAIGGALSGPLFLVADLHTPERWYNMLRIFRRTSTMSIGSWTLGIFGSMSAFTAGAQFLADRLKNRTYRRAARVFALPAAASGAVVATYTGTLLGATSTPLWASASRLLPALFGASAAATSTAALSWVAHATGAPPGTMRRLERLALITAGAELLISSAIDRQWEKQHVATPLKCEPVGTAYRGGYKGLGIIAPLIINGLSLLTRRRSRRLSIAAAVATLAGSYIMRSVILAAGKTSAEHPEDYFHFTNAR